MKVTVVIPNLNGRKYLKDCLDSLREQTFRQFHTIIIDNGSTDDSISFVKTCYPEVEVFCFQENTGFCKAVNKGIAMAVTPYVVLLNNDTRCKPEFLEALVNAMEEKQDAFSCASCMIQMYQPKLMDNAGDYYSALGWAYAYGKGRSVAAFQQERQIFSACAGAAIYRKSVFNEIGMFDEAHFAYLEDVDIAYRARIAGYRNYYIPSAQVYHVGSGTSGSTHNKFKVTHASRNSVYLVYKNMPLLQLVVNFPFLAAGYVVKTLFFIRKGFGKEYIGGLLNGLKMCKKEKKVRFNKKNLRNYLKIQLELWINMVRGAGVLFGNHQEK